MDQIQQGDVVAQRVLCVPEGARRVEPGPRGYVVAKGEATGHAHTIAPRDGLSMYEHEGTLYLVVEDVKVVEQQHEEHGPVTYAPGTWAIGQVQEMDWISGMVRRVTD